MCCGAYIDVVVRLPSLLPDSSAAGSAGAVRAGVPPHNHRNNPGQLPSRTAALFQPLSTTALCYCGQSLPPHTTLTISMLCYDALLQVDHHKHFYRDVRRTATDYTTAHKHAHSCSQRIESFDSAGIQCELRYVKAAALQYASETYHHLRVSALPLFPFGCDVSFVLRPSFSVSLFPF